jgi:hypothetical protein
LFLFVYLTMYGVNSEKYTSTVLVFILNVHILYGKLEFVIQDGTRRYKSLLSLCLIRHYATSAVYVT